MSNINNPSPPPCQTVKTMPMGGCHPVRQAHCGFVCNWCCRPGRPNCPHPCLPLRDYGPEPFVINIEEAAKQNNYFRLALWTGRYLQLTLMSIRVGGDVGLEMHPDVDQFIRVEEGQGFVMMGGRKDWLDFRCPVADDDVILIPAGKWHNLINTGGIPLKLYSIYAPPEHPHGTIHETQEDAAHHE